MRYLTNAIFSTFLSITAINIFADQPPLIIEEQDLSPTGVATRLRVTNGTLNKTGSIFNFQYTSSTLPSGSTQYIQNTDTLQSGATFYVSSGTISNSDDILLRLIRTSAFGPFKRTWIGFYQNSGGAPTLYNKLGFANTEGGGDFQGFGLYDGSGLPQWGMDRYLAPDFITFLTRMRIYNSLGTFYTSFQSSSSMVSNLQLILPLADGTANYPMITNGAGQLSFGLGKALGGTNNTILMGDAVGSTQDSDCHELSSFPLFAGKIDYCTNLFSLDDIGSANTVSIVNSGLTAKISAGLSSTFSSSYRYNYPDTPLGAYQAWTSTGPTGNTFQFQNTTVLVSTPGLQPGSTFYVSSGTVAGQFSAATGVFSSSVTSLSYRLPDATNAMPDREYWWPASATLPLEASADSIPPVGLISGASNFIDILSIDFDSAVDECRQWDIHISSSDLVQVTTVTFANYWMSISTNLKDVVWYVQQNSGANRGQYLDANLQTHAASANTVGTSTRTLTITEWDVSISSLAWIAGDHVMGKDCRDANNGADNMTGDASMVGFGIRLKRS